MVTQAAARAEKAAANAVAKAAADAEKAAAAEKGGEDGKAAAESAAEKRAPVDERAQAALTALQPPAPAPFRPVYGAQVRAQRYGRKSTLACVCCLLSPLTCLL